MNNAPFFHGKLRGRVLKRTHAHVRRAHTVSFIQKIKKFILLDRAHHSRRSQNDNNIIELTINQNRMVRDGDPRVTEAAALLIEQPSMTILQAMALSKFTKRECNSRSIQKNISKKKSRVLAASNRMNNEPVPSSVTTGNRSASVRSSLTCSTGGQPSSGGSSNDESDGASRSRKKM